MKYLGYRVKRISEEDKGPKKLKKFAKKNQPAA